MIDFQAVHTIAWIRTHDYPRMHRARRGRCGWIRSFPWPWPWPAPWDPTHDVRRPRIVVTCDVQFQVRCAIAHEAGLARPGRYRPSSSSSHERSRSRARTIAIVSDRTRARAYELDLLQLVSSIAFASAASLVGVSSGTNRRRAARRHLQSSSSSRISISRARCHGPFEFHTSSTIVDNCLQSQLGAGCM
jgi:hypothetical protein